MFVLLTIYAKSRRCGKTPCDQKLEKKARHSGGLTMQGVVTRRLRLDDKGAAPIFEPSFPHNHISCAYGRPRQRWAINRLRHLLTTNDQFRPRLSPARMRVSPTTRYVFRRHPACIHRVITEVIKCSFWLPRFTTACSSVPHKNVAQPLEIQPLEMKAGEQSAQSVITHASRDLERKFRSLADNSPDMIVRYDCNLRRTYVNRAWQNVTGISDAAALNHSPVELPGLMNAKAAAYEAKLRAVVLSGLPLNM